MEPKVLEVWDKISSHPSYLRRYLSSSRYTKEGPILQYGLKKRKNKERYLFLIGAYLLICRSRSKGRYRVTWVIVLTERKIVDVVRDSSYNPSNVEFRIYSPKRTFTFFAQSQQERDQWVSLIGKWCKKI